ncbi:hypothetical protein NHX12_026250 [Muraenolepis orangiensis]|uniref:Rho-GAP domain-containing protein n=1 Tax=Muraenolepis orangiensis TaxID=630683 RepID=A0A9Q0IRQ1_9TELE|nr:hypothetical protein NHX12_026250 [Muraenolepis orangiensis]
MSRLQQESQGVVLTVSGVQSNHSLPSPPPPHLDSRRTGHYSVQQQNNMSEHGHKMTGSTTHPPSKQASPGGTRYPRTHPGSSPRPHSSPRLRPSAPGLAYQRCNSQVGLLLLLLLWWSRPLLILGGFIKFIDSLGELAMDDYWKEVENISSSGGGEGKGEAGGEIHEDDQQKVPEEGELEEAWLVEAGLTRLFDDSLTPDLDQEEDSAVFLSTLTRAQAAAVERRVVSLQTLKRRNRQHAPDVRDIFRPPEKGDQATGLAEISRKYSVGIYCHLVAMNFKLLLDKTGQTRIGDLSSLDMKKVRRLVLVEMTALFDTCGIDLKAHKAVKVKAKESGLFGVPLATLLEQDQRRLAGTKVPLILQRLISHIEEEEGLNTEGLLRIPGVATRVKLKQHDAASLLKKFIRELPHPLLTIKYLNAFIAVDSTCLLTNSALVEFFQRVIDRQAQNKMTLNNVSVVMAPNMFIFKGYRAKVTGQQEVSMATSTANIVRQLIRYQRLLWTIPKFILTQVRQQNVENHHKLNREGAVRKLLKKITADKPNEKPADELTEELQAADVLTRFLSQERSVPVKRETLCLYEIGGNIKERCLNEETYMKDLVQLNPAAEWVIKTARR